jgi:hypothetical protein
MERDNHKDAQNVSLLFKSHFPGQGIFHV